mgnify:CR=1 FL=1
MKINLLSLVYIGLFMKIKVVQWMFSKKLILFDKFERNHALTSKIRDDSIEFIIWIRIRT